MVFSPIQNYGLIGNRETGALVSDDGSIDWFCYPDFDSPSVFAAILDDETGGHFSIHPTGDFEVDRGYLPRTNVLETRFETDAGEATLTDFMPAIDSDCGPCPVVQAICRKVVCTEGAVEMAVEFAPRFDYGRQETTLDSAVDGVVARGGDNRLALASPVVLSVDGASATGTVSLQAGESAFLPVQYGMRGAGDAVECPDVDALLKRTVDFWRDWAHDCEGNGEDSCPYAGPWHDLAVRSSLILKLLQHWTTGSIVAAPTTSLPEEIGGVRNWDYRFSWLRDSAFVAQALYRLGYQEEARHYNDWLLHHPDMTDPSSMQPVYGLHGETDLTERTVPNLSGYCGSEPVRIGNAAHRQLQLDVFGELVLGVYETTRQGELLTAREWETLRDIIDHVARVWDRKDLGIWEVRDRPRHLVHSKVMCWAALDRGIEMVSRWNLDAPTARWRTERSAIRERVLDEGFDETGNTFVRAFEDNALDAAVLQLPLLGFLTADDRRIQGTIDAVQDRLMTPNGLVYRYEGDDGIGGRENPFVLCSFWLVDCLALSGRVAEARELFENVADFAGPLGLYAEEIDPESGDHRGNFPQAFSHLGLVNSVRRLNAASANGFDSFVGDSVPDDREA